MAEHAGSRLQPLAKGTMHVMNKHAIRVYPRIRNVSSKKVSPRVSHVPERPPCAGRRRAPTRTATGATAATGRRPADRARGSAGLANVCSLVLSSKLSLSQHSVDDRARPLLSVRPSACCLQACPVSRGAARYFPAEPRHSGAEIQRKHQARAGAFTYMFSVRGRAVLTFWKQRVRGSAA